MLAIVLCNNIWRSALSLEQSCGLEIAAGHCITKAVCTCCTKTGKHGAANFASLEGMPVNEMILMLTDMVLRLTKLAAPFPMTCGSYALFASSA